MVPRLRADDVGGFSKARRLLLRLGVLAIVGPAAAQAADRARVSLACKAAAEALAYDCTVKLSNARTGAPLDKAELTIGADMPSMPMAHNVRPVTAAPTSTPGEYQARLVLEMHGDWALRLKVGGPVKDQLVEVLRFGPEGALPPPRKSGKSPAGGQHKH